MVRCLAMLAACLVGGGCGETVPAADAGPPGEGESECDAIVCPPLTECLRGACVGRDPCQGVSCDEGFACSQGSCVDARVDEDGDGFPASSDCDDHDSDVIPGATVECTSACGAGTTTCEASGWTACTAPTECTCAPGQERPEPCGRCGTATRLCGGDGEWVAELGPCEGEGECSPSAEEVADCAGAGACVRHTRACDEDCTWGPYGACEGADECVPGENGTEACGSCGERVRTCTDQCLWGAYGPCENEGVCVPGATTSQSCGDCGTQTRTCSASCTWGAYGACGGEGPCAPDETSNRSCGNCGSQTRTCEENCTWGAYGNCGGEGVCTPGATQELSCNECGTQNQVCSAACAWANSGSCDNTPGLPASCDDADSCTTDTCDAAGNCSNTGCGGGTPNCCAGRCRECCSNADCVGGEICCGLPTYACALAQNCPVSDRNMKTGFATVEPEEVLETLASVPVSTWSYIGEEGVRHMGPMAQDFHAAYGLGETDTRIHVLDQGGVAFSSIQALRERTEQLRRENAALRDENERLVEALRTLERRVTNLERHRERPD